MDVHVPTLQMSVLVVAVMAAAITSLLGMLVRVYRGYDAWVAAQWLLAASVAAVLMTSPGTAWRLVAELAMVQWPIMVLWGLRRFQSRKPMKGSARGDFAVLVAVGVVLTAAHGAAGAQGTTIALPLAVSALHGYAAWRAFHTPTMQVSRGHRLLAWTVAACATFAAAIGLAAITSWPEPAHGALLLWALQSLAAMVLMQFALLLTTERTVGELRDSRRRLRFLANIDMLTQVPNRRHFGELARRTLQMQDERSAAVLMFDIDHFKRINDELGHAAGDRALRVVSQCVQGTLRGQDVAGRHGGDEFVLLLPDTTMRDAMAVAARIVQRAQQMAASQAIPNLSLSFGMVQMSPDEALEEAMRRADQALYEAKRQGRGRAVSAAGDEHKPVFVESRRLGLTPG